MVQPGILIALFKAHWGLLPSYSVLIELTFSFHCSKFLYDITRSDSTNPAASVVRIWLEKLGKQMGVAFHYAERLHSILVKRVSYLKMKKNLKGGAPRQILSATLGVKGPSR